MLKKLLNTLGRLATNRVPINLSVFGKPLAEQTEWTPLKDGGQSFCTHRLVKLNLNRIEFRVSTGAKLYCGMFILAGVAGAVLIIGRQIAKGMISLRPETLLAIGFGAVFVAIDGWKFHHFATPIVFDKREGFFWRGRKSPTRMNRRASMKYSTEINQINALQLINVDCDKYYSHELNLVLRDGKRLNVVEHGNEDKLRRDTEELSQFLGKPVWDAI